MDADDNNGANKTTDPWREHPLRAFLEAELANYNIPVDVDEMGPKEVWQTYCNREDTAHLFEGMVFGAAFKRRLASLRATMGASLNRAAMDQMAFDTHRRNFPYQTFDDAGKRNWYGSAAEELLEEDLADGLYPTMKPAQLYALRPEYQEFSLDVFRGHIHQSIGTAKYYHTLKFRDEAKKAAKQKAEDDKKKKAAKKAAKEAEKKVVQAAKEAAKKAVEAAKEAEKIAKQAAKAAEKAEKEAAKAAKRAAKKAGNST
jgi:hypothetical protein